MSEAVNNEKNCNERYFELDGELSKERQRVAALENELEVTESLLNERQRVLKAIPECPQHGECVPHAIEWIERMKQAEALITLIEGAVIDHDWQRIASAIEEWRQG